VSGVEVEWGKFWSGERRQRVELPAYPFQRQRYWIDVPAARQQDAPAAGQQEASAAGEARADVRQWFYLPSWLRSGEPAWAVPEESGSWLVFDEEEGVGEAVLRALGQAGRKSVRVRRGARYERAEAGSFRLEPGQAGGYEDLLEGLRQSGGLEAPLRIVHAWSSARDGEARSQGYYSLLWLVRALARRVQGQVEVLVVSRGLQEVSGQEVTAPELALLGPLRRGCWPSGRRRRRKAWWPIAGGIVGCKCTNRCESWGRGGRAG
jgi:acyl transferase domain-containing protein